MGRYYTFGQVDRLIDRYVKLGGDVTTVKQGKLGYGITILDKAEGYKNIVIEEVAENAHIVKQYSKLPKKYVKMLKAYHKRIRSYMEAA